MHARPEGEKFYFLIQQLDEYHEPHCDVGKIVPFCSKVTMGRIGAAPSWSIMVTDPPLGVGSIIGDYRN